MIERAALRLPGDFSACAMSAAGADGSGLCQCRGLLDGGIQAPGFGSKIREVVGTGEGSMGAGNQMLECGRAGEPRSKPPGSVRKVGTGGHRWQLHSGHQRAPWQSMRGLTCGQRSSQ